MALQIDPKRFVGLRQRALSSIALLLIVLSAEWFGQVYFMLLVIVCALLMIREWDTLTEDQGPIWRILGLIYVALPCASIIWLREAGYGENQHAGFLLTLYVMIIICATDIGGYFIGSAIGGPKIAPSISAGKTWAGLGGCMASAGLMGGLGVSFTPYPDTFLGGVAIGALLAVVAQMGDLFESWVKRRAGVKDSGSLIPGHGGILDRADGFMFATPLYALLVYLSGQGA